MFRLQYPKQRESEIKDWQYLIDKYPNVKIFFYEDSGVDLALYIPQLRPHSLKKHFEKYKDILQDRIFFYHDSDIIFNFLPNFDILCQGDINWQSDTSHYLDYNYLRRKEEEGNIPSEEAISVLCNIGNISIETMRAYSNKTGGAQYILKGIDYNFWEDIERQVIEIRKKFTFNQPNSINSKYFESENKGFQSWCADMWAVNMALWNRDKITDITPELDFSWATDSNETYSKKPIYHNAGATGVEPGVFCKSKWINKSPIGLNHAVSKNSASWNYAQIIMECKK